MIAELRIRLGTELDRLSEELEARTPLDPGSCPESPGSPARKEVQRILQRRIRLLGQLVAGLACVDPGAVPVGRAGYGSVVRVRDVGSGREESYTLMAGDFIDLDEGQVSLASPIGHALLGRAVGERVAVVTPRGRRQYEVVDVATLPARLGIGADEQDATALQVA